jgi:hypothetical protein
MEQHLRFCNVIEYANQKSLIATALSTVHGPEERRSSTGSSLSYLLLYGEACVPTDVIDEFSPAREKRRGEREETAPTVLFFVDILLANTVARVCSTSSSPIMV